MVAFNLPSEYHAQIGLGLNREGAACNFEENHTISWNMPMRKGDFFQSDRLDKKLAKLSVPSMCVNPSTTKIERPWWDALDRSVVTAAKSFDDYNFIRRQIPTEQYIVGRDGRGVRIYNYGEPMELSHVESCENFIAAADATFGIEFTQAVAGDIVFTRLRQPSNPGAPKDLGYRTSLFAGVLFLSDEFTEYEKREVSVEHVLAHEFGHVFDPKNSDELQALKRFGHELGWNSAVLDKTADRWATNETDLRTVRELDCPPVLTENARGVPTTYAQKSLHESLAETVALELSGELAHIPWLRETLHSYLDETGVTYTKDTQQRQALNVEHRTGDDILYPL